jgi:hypothetical protein
LKNEIKESFANDANTKPQASRLVMRRCSKNLVVAVVACFLFSTAMLAQNAALLLWQGVLLDAAGVPIRGAGVRLVGKGGTFKTTTDADGQFRIELMPAGQYQLSVDANHDKIQYASPIDIERTSPTAVITLTAQKSLSVTSVTDQHSATGGEALSSQTVSELPLNKRDFSQLLLLAAGTMTDANGATNFTQQFAVNGQRGVEAVFAMDGADISDPEMGGSTFSNFMLTRSKRFGLVLVGCQRRLAEEQQASRTSSPGPAATDFMGRSLSLSGTRPSMHATILTMLRLSIPNGSHPFAETSLGLQTAPQ